MKKKSDSPNIVTAPVLKRELNKVKYELKKEIKNEVSLLEARVQLMIVRLKTDIDEKTKQYRDEFLTAIDPILKEVLVAREDRTITTHRLVELQEKVEDHEERLRQLEPR